MVAKIAADTVEAFREEIRERDDAPDPAEIMAGVDDRCAKVHGRRLKKVINATGIVIHTNMGRAPIPQAVWSAAESVNTGYSNLEISLETGKRDRRGGILTELLSLLVGCESATVVNNCAAALFLMLVSHASGREVIVSRGEQIQIGGGFRIPEMLRMSGADLVEVGTTNVTTANDYAGALSDRTAMVLVVHSSNFEISGFTAKPSVADISRVLPQETILVVDQGSGVTTETMQGEMQVRHYLSSGADLVSFSGDKVLGGPQAGVVTGRRDLIEAMERHQLMRMLRAGKTIRSLLEEHLVQKLNGMAGSAEQAMALSPEELRRRGRLIKRRIGPIPAELVPTVAAIGGGSAPERTFASLSLRIDADVKPELLLEKLRGWKTPIIGTVSGDRVHLNLTTIDPGEIAEAAAALTTLLPEA